RTICPANSGKVELKGRVGSINDTRGLTNRWRRCPEGHLSIQEKTTGSALRIKPQRTPCHLSIISVLSF
ncbi:MAG: hypothetical protein RLZ25_688, partial [Pseudomonadota bacterium]